MAAQNRTIRVTFTHPRDSRKLEAEIGATTTAQQALDELIKADFVARPPGGEGVLVLQHAKTGKSIPANKSLVEAGVEAGDTVAITETSVSAGA